MVEISVIIPAYNAIDYLDEALDSIINQSFEDLEIICVDDGSTDTTLERLEYYASKDSRVQVYTQENQGPGGATNTGLSKAKGKYVYFMDADDILDLNALEELYNIMEEKELDFVIFKAISYDDLSGKYFENKYHTMPQLHECVRDSIFDWRDIGNTIFNISVTPWSKLYRHELIKKSGAKFPSRLIYQDNVFFWEILFNSNRIYFHDEFLYTRRVHSSSIVHSHNKKSVDIMKISDLVIQVFLDYGHFEDFKGILYNKMVNLPNYRYRLIKEEFKEYFFIEMAKHFEKIIGHNEYDDFYSNLSSKNKSFFNNAISSNNHIEYDLKNELFDLKNKNKKLKKQLNSLKKKNNKLNKQNNDLNKEINYLNKFNESLLFSKSWKITKPFRAFMNFFRKF